MPSICVFCGSRPGVSPTYLNEAKAMGQGLAAAKWQLVYGAGDIGLMGAVAEAAQKAGGETFGVIPQHLLDWEVGNRNLTHFIVTDTMHERKKLMFTNSDGIVVLPGGAGSLDEFFEVLTWAQLALHSKPMILVNVESYWDPLLALLDHVIKQGFADPSLTSLFEIVPDSAAALNLLAARLS